MLKPLRLIPSLLSVTFNGTGIPTPPPRDRANQMSSLVSSCTEAAVSVR